MTKLQIESFDNIWDAIEPDTAKRASLKMRSEVMAAIVAHVRSLGMTQAAAAKALGITQPRLNDLLRGRIANFSLDALVDITSHAGLGLTVRIALPRRGTKTKPKVKLVKAKAA
jgi:predicted XRE-type DNA-binding protein